MSATLYFTKEFTGGILKGIRINEKMRFASAELAREWWLKARLGITKPCCKTSPYRVVDASFQNYQRQGIQS